MSRYLTADDLAELIGCAPTSFACMKRYLTRNNWPFEPNLRGFPQVSREYHDARLAGISPTSAPQDEGEEPDFSMFEAA